MRRLHRGTVSTSANGDDGLGTVAVSGRVVICHGCGDAEGVAECECCCEHQCPDCWGEGANGFCESCLVEGPEPQAVESVKVRDRYL